MGALLKPGLCLQPSGEYRCCTDYKQVRRHCIPCLGSFGINCTGGVCLYGYYGFGCQELCTCNRNEVCDPVVGCQAVEMTRLSIGETLAITFSVLLVLVLIPVIIFKRRKSSRVLRAYEEERTPEDALYHSYIDMESGYEICTVPSLSNNSSNRKAKFTKNKNPDFKEEKLKTQKERSGNASSLFTKQQDESEADSHSYISVLSSTETRLSKVKEAISSSTTKAIPRTHGGKPVSSIEASDAGTEAKRPTALKTTVSTKRTTRIRDTILLFEKIPHS